MQLNKRAKHIEQICITAAETDEPKVGISFTGEVTCNDRHAIGFIKHYPSTGNYYFEFSLVYQLDHYTVSDSCYGNLSQVLSHIALHLMYIQTHN